MGNILYGERDKLRRAPFYVFGFDGDYVIISYTATVSLPDTGHATVVTTTYVGYTQQHGTPPPLDDLTPGASAAPGVY